MLLYREEFVLGTLGVFDADFIVTFCELLKAVVHKMGSCISLDDVSVFSASLFYLFSLSALVIVKRQKWEEYASLGLSSQKKLHQWL